jgi:hypothetical protein
MSSILEKAVEMTQKQIQIVYVKDAPSSAIPANGVNFAELIDTKGK